MKRLNRLSYVLKAELNKRAGTTCSESLDCNNCSLVESLRLIQTYVIGRVGGYERVTACIVVCCFHPSIERFSQQKRSRPQQLKLCRSSHAEALQATVSEGLAQGSYVADRARFEPAALRSKGLDSTNAPPRPTE